MKRAIVFPTSLVLVAVACVTVCLATRVRHPRAVTLADGSKLEYLGSTVGANSSFDYGSAWQKLVARLPDSWKRKFGGTAQNTVVKAGYYGDSNIVFWFVRRNEGGGTAGIKTTNVVYKGASYSPTYAIGVGELRDDTFGPSVAAQLRINLKDERGEGTPGLARLGEADLPSGDVALFWRTDPVPAAGRVVSLRLYQWAKAKGWKCIGELATPNPHSDTQR